jgi:hypothetical protein
VFNTSGMLANELRGRSHGKIVGLRAGEHQCLLEHTMSTLPVRLIIYIVLLAAGLSVFVEAGCRTERYQFSQEWSIRYEASPWQSATPIQNCRINLRQHMQKTLRDFGLVLWGEWSRLDEWYQILIAGVAAILGITTFDLMASILRSKKRKERRGSRGSYDKHEVRNRARRRL